jgi:metabolite-proton symporter
VTPAESDQRRHLTRVVVASSIGTTIEWYDFFLYGIASALVFPHKFFPASDPFVATLLSFSTFFVGFAARPVGAALFGHFGDRVGRKSLLIATLMLMGVATATMGLVPGYDLIGIWGAVLLTVGRVLQGVAVGGEWSGSVLMAGEWTDPKLRGFTTSFAQMGAPAGMVLANGALVAVNLALDEQAFLSWGWRIPFVASLVLVGIGFYIRRGIHESPIFTKIRDENRLARAPLADVVRENWREIALTALLRTGEQVPFYVFTTYILVYANRTLGMPRAMILGFVLVQCAVSLLTIPFAGYLSDRYGRRLVTAIGCVMMIVYPFIYFDLLDTRVPWLMFIAIVLAGPAHDLQYGPQAAFIAESFPGSRRYSGSALGYQLASITAGGPAPLIATLLLEKFQTSMAIAAYISICAVISLVCVAALAHNAGSLDDQ